MASIPAVPYGNIVPIMIPMHLEQGQTALFKQFHTIVVYSYRYIVLLGPILQHFFCIFVAYNYQVQGFAVSGILDRHLMQGYTRWHSDTPDSTRGFLLVDQLFKFCIQLKQLVVMLCCILGIDPNKSHECANRHFPITACVHDLADINYKVLHNLF